MAAEAGGARHRGQLQRRQATRQCRREEPGLQQAAQQLVPPEVIHNQGCLCSGDGEGSMCRM
jgi:hypothetical protein